MKQSIAFLLIISPLIFFPIGCSGEKEAYNEALEKNTLVVYEQFIKEYPDSKKIWWVKEQIELLKYQDAKSKNTIDAYSKYLKEYPGGTYRKLAKMKLNELRYQDVKSKDDIIVYQQFLKEYPNSSYKKEIKKSIERLKFREAQDTNTVSSYKNFLSEYPETEYREQVLAGIDSVIVESMNDVKVLSLRLFENFPGDYTLLTKSKKNIKRIKSIFNEANVELISDNPELSGSILSIELNGDPLSQYYLSIDTTLSGTHYTGASVSGYIKLIKDNEELTSLKFKGYQPCSEHIYRPYRDPNDAPFILAFNSSDFYDKIKHLVKKVWRIPF